jgi:ATP-dependent RNA helicase DDX10/DBP4
VRFVLESFKKLRPGTSLRGLHGNMKQFKRSGVYSEFCAAKSMVGGLAWPGLG